MSILYVLAFVLLAIFGRSDASFEGEGMVEGFPSVGVVAPAMAAPIPYEMHEHHHPSETRNLVGAYSRESGLLTDVSIGFPARARARKLAAMRAARMRKNLHKKKRN